MGSDGLAPLRAALWRPTQMAAVRAEPMGEPRKLPVGQPGAGLEFHESETSINLSP